MLHLILGVAGGIMLAVYAIATIERWRERRAYSRWMAVLYPKVRGRAVWPAVVFSAMGIGLMIFAATYFGVVVTH